MKKLRQFFWDTSNWNRGAHRHPSGSSDHFKNLSGYYINFFKCCAQWFYTFGRPFKSPIQYYALWNVLHKNWEEYLFKIPTSLDMRCARPPGVEWCTMFMNLVLKINCNFMINLSVRKDLSIRGTMMSKYVLVMGGFKFSTSLCFFCFILSCWPTRFTRNSNLVMTSSSGGAKFV